MAKIMTKLRYFPYCMIRSEWRMKPKVILSFMLEGCQVIS